MEKQEVRCGPYPNSLPGAVRKLPDAHVRVGVLFFARRCPNEQAFTSLIETLRAAALRQERTGAERVIADVSVACGSQRRANR